MLHLSWAGQPAGAIVHKIQKTLPREYSRISIAYKTNKLRELLPSYNTCSKLNDDYMLASNIVYKYSCDCGQCYIGETKRRLAVRAGEHAKQKSPMMDHIRECDDAEFSLTKFSIIAKRLRGREARKRYESIYIRYYDRHTKTINVCKSSRQLLIF